MILGLGLDITTISRVERAWNKFGLRFARKILHATELESLAMRGSVSVQFLASRFAAKEAAVKALGTGFSEGIGLHDVETLPLPSGQPELRLRGKAAARAEALGVKSIHVSLSHELELAAAIVVLEN